MVVVVWLRRGGVVWCGGLGPAAQTRPALPAGVQLSAGLITACPVSSGVPGQHNMLPLLRFTAATALLLNITAALSVTNTDLFTDHDAEAVVIEGGHTDVIDVTKIVNRFTA